MNVLGIVMTTGSTAALLVDGRVAACVSEERFSRSKNDERYPKRAIEAVLAESKVDPRELDLVAFSGELFEPRYFLTRRWSTWSTQDRFQEQRDYWYPKMYLGREPDYYEMFRHKLDLDQYPGHWDDVMAFETGRGARPDTRTYYQDFRRRLTSQHLHIDPTKVVFPHHHSGHGYYALYASPVREGRVLVLTGDAWGDDMNASVSVAENGTVTRLSSATNFQLARLYRSITLLLGMKPDEHEYKLMGLAAYAGDKYIQGPLKVFRDTMYVDGTGFAYHEVPSDLYVYFQKRLEGYRFDAIAGALQRYVEEVLVEWVRNCLVATGARALCIGGGIAMNVKAMMEVAKLEGLDELFVCPAPSDESLAIGTTYVAVYDQCVREGVDPRSVLKPLANAYLGPDLDADELRAALAPLRSNPRYAVRDTVDLSRVAALLASGKIVGRCAGRSEFGPRALGNRSILADPRQLESVQTINQKVKSRDFWMPFAPSILEERASDYLVNPKGLRAPFMTVAFETTEKARRELKAALHQADLTCRPQLVSRTANPEYHALILEFERLTGVGAVLNTSLNIHGEPIVQTAADAVDVLERSGLDALIVGDCLVEKIA